MINDDKMIEDFMKRISKNSKSSNTQYQYSYVELEEVVNNPTEYIIPECLPACQVFWDKNIETFMVSNNEDSNLYVLFCNLSNENRSLMENLMEVDSRFIFDDYRGTFGIQVSGKDERASQELVLLASRFKMQDTLRFKSSEQFLQLYKHTDGGFVINDYGHIVRLENPKLADISLEEALIQSNKEQLYVSEEDRVYDSMFYLNWHKRYLQYVDENGIDAQSVHAVDNIGSSRV